MSIYTYIEAVICRTSVKISYAKMPWNNLNQLTVNFDDVLYNMLYVCREIESIKYFLNILLKHPCIDMNYLKNIIDILNDNGNLECIKFVLDMFQLNSGLIRYIIEKNMLEVFKYMDRSYPNIIFEKFDEKKMTVLHVAAINGHMDFIRYLVEERGFDVETRNFHRVTPLKEACERDHLDCVTYLYSKGASIETKDKINQTPIFTVCYNGILRCLNFLLDKGAAADICNDRGQTPLYWAARQNHLNVVNRLLEKNVQVDVPDRGKQRTALSWVCQSGSLEVVRRLISVGADVNHQDVYKKTPLMWAASSGHLDVVKELLTAGADKSLRSTARKTAYDYAVVEEHIDCARILQLNE